jgi:predicted secreted protein
MAAPKWAAGTLLKRGDGASPETFTAIAKADNLQGPGLKRAMIDVTALDTATSYDEFVAGIKSGGEVSIDLFFMPDDPGHQHLLTDFDNGTLRNFQLYFPSATPITWSFAAYVFDYQPKAAIKSALTAAVKFKISGQPTLTES